VSLFDLGASAVVAEVQCSRASCDAAAAWNVNWRNPRIHPEDRVKIWLACDEHKEFLRDYLASRGFPVVVTELGVAIERLPPVLAQ
jgi:hypothetical protein